MMLKSHIIIAQEIEGAAEAFATGLGHNHYKHFVYDAFQVEHAHELIAHAYIASEYDRFLIVRASNYNTVSQNALLKLLEEPPSKVHIVLIAPSKSIFLPTIRSRLPMRIVPFEKAPLEVEFDFSTLSLSTLYQFLKEKRYLSKKEALDLLQGALLHYREVYHEHPVRELEQFEEAFLLLERNSPPIVVITSIFLLLVEKHHDQALSTR